MIKAKLIERLNKSQSRYKNVVVPKLKAKIERLEAKVLDLEAKIQNIRDITRFGKIVKRFPREYLSEIGSRGGKTSASKMTEAERIDRAKKARAAQLTNEKGGKR